MVYEILREAITSGVFEPGEHLQQDRIADMLDVSRMPVRASLQRLETDGLVVFNPHRGATVRELTPDEIAEIYELRILLETYALRRAIENITDDQIAELKILVMEMDTEPKPEMWFDSRQLFYRRLYEIADRPKLSEFIHKLRIEVGRYWMMLRVTDHPRGHQGILDFIEQRNATGAAEWLEQHLTTVSEELQRIVANTP